jgi:hypothetical protein
MRIKLPAAIRLDNEGGFAFVMALMVMLLLTSLGILVFLLTTKDQIASARLTAEEKSLSAAEHGVSLVMQNFVPGTTSGWQQVSSIDPYTQYYYSIPAVASNCSGSAGYNSGTTTGQCYAVQVRGRNTNFVGEQRLIVGIRVTTMGSSASAEY